MLMNEVDSADNKYIEYMEEWIGDLVQIIEKEINTFQAFLETLSELQKSIVEGNLSQITQRSEKARGILSEARSISGARQDKLTQFASTTQINQDLVTLEKVIPLVESKYAERLTVLRQTLMTTLNKVKYSSHATRRLLVHSLSFVDQNIEIMGAGNKKPELYRKNNNFYTSVQVHHQY